MKAIVVKDLGYEPGAKKERFLVKETYGPLREGEIERAKAWGAALAGADRKGAGLTSPDDRVSL